MFTMHIKLIISAFLLLVAGGGVAYVYSATDAESVSPTESTDVSESGVIHITVLANDVFLTQKGSLTVVKIDKEATTSVGATIRTSATGRALIEAPDKTMTLDFDSQITIPAVNNTKVNTVILLSGSLWARVEKIFEKGEYFEIRTQDTVAAVRGTSFGASYKNNITTVLVAESKVAVTPLNKETGELAVEKEVLVTAGEKAVKKENADPVVSKQTTTDKDAWYEFNINAKFEVKKSETNDSKSDVRASVETTGQTKTVEKATEIIPKTLDSEPTKTLEETSKTSDTTTGGSSSSSVSPLPPGKIELKELSPKSAKEKSLETFTLTGRGFSHAVGVFLTQEGNEKTHKPSFKVVDDATITFTLPTDSLTGTYNVVVASDSEEGATLDESLIVF